jgi:hypothetical protein
LFQSAYQVSHSMTVFVDSMRYRTQCHDESGTGIVVPVTANHQEKTCAEKQYALLLSVTTEKQYALYKQGALQKTSPQMHDGQRPGSMQNGLFHSTEFLFMSI